MTDGDKTKEQLQQELADARRELAELRRRETQHERATAGLMQAVADLRAIFDAFPDLLFRMAPDGTILDYRAGRPADLYAPPEVFLGKRAQDVLPPDVAQRAEAAIHHVITTNRPATFEYWLALPVGKQAFEVRLVPSPDHQLVAIVRNITDRKRAEEQLRASEANYRAIFDAANDAIFVHDAKTGQILDVNQKMTEMYGYSREEARGLSVGDLSIGSAPYDEKHAQEWIHKAAAGQPARFDWLAKDKAGNLFWVEVNLKRAKIGGRDRLLALVRDITERKRAEEERQRLLDRLREANTQLVASNLRERQAANESQRRAAELAAIIDSIVDPVFVVDAQGHLTLTNQAGARLLQVEWPKDKGISITTFPQRARMRHLDGRPVTMEDAPLARALRGETVKAEDSVVFSQQAEHDVYVSISTAPIRDEAGQPVGAVGVARDITSLIEVDRMKDDFIRVAAHELKTPVAIMKGYAQALVRAPQADPAQREKMLDAINRGSDRITRIIDDLLDVSQLQLGRLVLEREKLDMLELVRAVMDHMAPTAPKHHLRLVKAEPALVLGDRQRLEQVVAQLVDNAIKYSPRDGNVDIAVEARDGEALVSVRDHGIGIPQQKQARIFQRFYRAHTGTPYDYGGMGVGLYIAREIVRAHGGRMWFTSEEGQGSTFYFTLPLK